MFGFNRLTSILFFVLSLGMFAYALPAPVESKTIAARYGGDDLHGLIVKLYADVQADVQAIVDVQVVADVAAKVDVLVGHVNACAQAVVAIGANIDIDADIKADIVVKVAASIKLIVEACVSLVAKFGIFVLLTLLAKIDICLNLLLVNLGVCVQGIVALIAQIVVKLGVSVLASVHLGLCINVLGLIGLSL